MKKAKERVNSPRRLLGVVAIAGLGLGELGCAGMSGLRSVGAERTSLFGFRDSPRAASPSPANDLYAQNMHSADPKPEPSGKNTALASSSPTVSPSSSTPLLSATDPTNGPELSAPRDPSAGENSVRVTLGRPEPLPGRDAMPKPNNAIAARSPSSTWKPDSARRVDSPKPPARDTEILAHNSPADTKPSEPSAIIDYLETRIKALNSYQVRVSRVERTGSQVQPEEDLLLSIQREPRAVRLEWTDGPNKGREVIYSSAIDPRNIFVHVPTTPIQLPTMKIAVDNPLVMRNSRHAITEAGFDTIVENLRKARLSGPGGPSNSSGQLAYRGIGPAQGVEGQAHHFVRTTPGGETWDVYLDTKTLYPRLVQATDAKGDLIERYIYRDVIENPAELKTAAAFVPEERWRDSKNLLSKLTRGPGGPAVPTESQTTRR